MTELPIPPKELQGLGKLIAFGNPDRGIQGTQFYLKPEAVEKYKDHKFSKKTLKEFSLFDGQSAKDQGVDSARLKMITHPGDKKDAQTSLTPPTELRSNPVTGETLPLKNAWGVRMMDDKTQFVDIPIEDLTTEKPKTKPRTPKKPTVTKNPRKVLETIRTGSADATKIDTTSDNQDQDNISYSDDGVTPGLITHDEPVTPDVTPQPPIDIPADNISMADDGVTPGILGHDGSHPLTPEPTPTIPPEKPPVITPIPDVLPLTPDVIPSTPDVTPLTPDTPPSTPDVLPSTPDVTSTPPATTEAPRKNVVTIVGIQEAFKRRATDFAKEAMEKSRNIVKKFFGERFEERYYQHFHRMLEAAQNPFARESVAKAQEYAQARYDGEMAQRNGLSRAARRTWDRIKEYTFGTTTVDQYAVEMISDMQQHGQIQEQASFDQEMQEFVKRFEVPFEESNTAIRHQLGERLEILNPDNAEHKPLIDGIKGLVREYRDGTIPDAKVLNERLHALYETTLSPGRQDLLGEAETYASSLAVVAKDMKDRLSHGESLATLDGELEAMQVRLGIGQMGEATEINATSTHKTVEWIKKTARDLERRGIIHNVVLNEFTVGSAVSAVLALKMIPQAAASASARMWIGGGAGAVITGAISTGREFGRRQGELRRIGAQKEAGIRTPDTARQRQWYETFNFQLRTTKDLITSMQSPILDADGQMKSTITTDELRLSAANLADAKARSAISQREHNRFGLITLGAVGEQETNRTALAQSMIKTETNLKTYLNAHRQDQNVIDLIGPTRTVEQYLESLTTAQTQILNEGNQVLTNLNDTYIRTALDPLKVYTPEVDVMRRTLGLVGKAESKGKESGIDALLQEFKKQATVESVRTGIKTAGIGLAMGTISNEVVMDLKHGFGSGALSGLFMHGGPEAAGGASPILPTTHIETIGTQHIVLSDNMHIDATGNLDVTDGLGHIHDNVISDMTHHVQFDANGTMHLDQSALDQMYHSGLVPSVTSESTISTVEHTAAVANHTINIPTDGEHPVNWDVPINTHFVQIDNTHYNLVQDLPGNHQETVLSNLPIDEHGKLLDPTAIQQQIDQYNATHMTMHLHLGPETSTSTVLPGTSGEVDTSPGRVIHYLQQNQMETPPTTLQHGEVFGAPNTWDVFLKDATTMPGTNAVKHLMRSYHLYDVNDQGIDITTGKQAISFDTIRGMEGLTRDLNRYYHDTIWGRAIYYNALPNNTVMTLPSAFSPENVSLLDQWTNEAIARYAHGLGITATDHYEVMQQLESYFSNHNISRDVMEASFGNDRMGWILFKAGYLGQEYDVPTKDELHFVFDAIRNTGNTPAETIDLFHSVISAETISQTPVTTIQNTFTIAEQFMRNEPEGFIPIIPNGRKGLEPVDMPKVVPPVVTPPVPPVVTPPVPLVVTPPTKGDNDVEKGDTFHRTTTMSKPPIIMPPPPPPKISEEEERNKKKKIIPTASSPSEVEVIPTPSIVVLPNELKPSTPIAVEETREEEENPELPQPKISNEIPLENRTPIQEKPEVAESLPQTINVPVETTPIAQVEQQNEKEKEEKAKPEPGHDADISVDQDLQQIINDLNNLV